MRYKPKSAAALEIALGGLPNNMRVEVDSDVGVSAKTLGAVAHNAGYDLDFLHDILAERSTRSANTLAPSQAATTFSPSRPIDVVA